MPGKTSEGSEETGAADATEAIARIATETKEADTMMQGLGRVWAMKMKKRERERAKVNAFQRAQVAVLLYSNESETFIKSRSYTCLKDQGRTVSPTKRISNITSLNYTMVH